MNLPFDEYIRSLPRKRVGAAALFFNSKNQLLVVKPKYRDGWLVPGGSVEGFESPLAGCLREIKEEIGLDWKEVTLLGVNYIKGVLKNGENDEALHFLFYAGTLNNEQIKKICLQDDELSEYKFVDPEEAYTLLSDRLSKRVREGIEALKKNTVFYSEYLK